MLNARYNPLVSQAEITGKAQPDLHSLRQRAYTQGRQAYEGGSIDANLAIMPGELLVARKNCRNTSGAYGRFNQCGFTSVAGITTDDKNPEELMRDLTFLGVAKSEYQYGGENLFGTDPLDHGFGYLISGSITIINTGTQDIHAFDQLAIRVPPYPQGDPRSQGTPGSYAIDTGLNPLRPVNRIGTPNGKPLFMIERFDPCDFTFQVAGSFELIKKTKANGGIEGITFQDFFNRNNDASRKLSSAQEEAFGYVYGLLTVARIANPTIKYIKKNGKVTAAGVAFLKDVYGRNVFPGSNPGFEDNRAGNLLGKSKEIEKFLKDHIFDLLCGSIGGSIAAKNARRIGTAIGSAKPGQSLDAMIRLY
jgi:hypothetical protein